MSTPHTPPGFATINPFIITRDADSLIQFLTNVFDGIDHPEARTIDTDGLLLHAELQIGDSTLMFAERKPDWPFTPALLQVYVDDVDATLRRAAAQGAEIITRPTDFLGFHIFSRFLDPWRNLWWVYSAPVTPETDDAISRDTNTDTEDAEDGWADDGQAWEPAPELTYIRDTVVAVLPRLRDPHT